MSERVVWIYAKSPAWTLEIDSDWDTMTEQQRQEYIYEAAVDSGMLAFDYGMPHPKSEAKP